MDLAGNCGNRWEVGMIFPKGYLIWEELTRTWGEHNNVEDMARPKYNADRIEAPTILVAALSDFGAGKLLIDQN